MTDKEKLIEILQGAERKVKDKNPNMPLNEWLDIYADELLAEGVIVPPNEAIIFVKGNWLMLNKESEHLGEAIKQCVDYLTKNAKECEGK